MSERIEQSFELTVSGTHLPSLGPVIARPFLGPATRWGHSQPVASGMSDLAQMLLPRTADLPLAA